MHTFEPIQARCGMHLISLTVELSLIRFCDCVANARTLPNAFYYNLPCCSLNLNGVLHYSSRNKFRLQWNSGKVASGIGVYCIIQLSCDTLIMFLLCSDSPHHLTIRSQKLMLHRGLWVILAIKHTWMQIS